MAVPPVTSSNKANLPDLSETNLKPGEGNFTRIKTSIWEALSKVNLSPYESRLVDVVVRKTFGWNKVRAWISLSQFEQMSGIQRWNVQEVLKRLIEKRIIIRTEHGQRMVYEINQNFAEWKGYPNRTDLVTSQATQGDKSVTKHATLDSPLGGTQPENNPVISENLGSIVIQRDYTQDKEGDVIRTDYRGVIRRDYRGVIRTDAHKRNIKNTFKENIYGRNQKTDCDQAEDNGCEGNSIGGLVEAVKPMLPSEGLPALLGRNPLNASPVAIHGSAALPRGQASPIVRGEEVSPEIASGVSQSASPAARLPLGASPTDSPRLPASAPRASGPETPSAGAAPRAGKEPTKKTKREKPGKKHQPECNLQNARRIIPVFSEARPGREAAGTVGSKDVGNFLTFENALQIESRVAKDYCPKEQWPLKNPWADLAMGASRKNQPPTLKEVKHNSPEGSISDDDLFAPKPINSADSKEPPEPPWEPEDKPMKTGNVAWDARSALEEAEIQETMEWFKRHAVSVLSGIVEVTEEQIDHVVDMEDQLGMIPKDSQELLEWLTSSLLMKKFGENEAGGIDCPSDLIERAGERVCAHFLF